MGHRGSVFSVGGFPSQAIDTTGAGDYFISGFLYGYIHGFSLADCARLGNRLGSAIVEVMGAELPDWTPIYSFLEEKKAESDT